MEARNLRLKFATSIYKNITTNTIVNNYRICDTDFSKGFIQGIILTAISQPNESSLPKRYTLALSNLTQNPNIIIFRADKTGDVVIMHKQRYVGKINSLLENMNTYEISNLTTMNKIHHRLQQTFQKTHKELKILDIPHRTPPYNTNIIWPT